MTRVLAWFTAVWLWLASRPRWRQAEHELTSGGVRIATVTRLGSLRRTWTWRIDVIADLEHAAGWGVRQALTGDGPISGLSRSPRAARSAAAKRWRQIVNVLRERQTRVVLAGGRVTVETQQLRMQLEEDDDHELGHLGDE